MKKCNQCHNEYEESFFKHGICKNCVNLNQRNYRKITCNSNTHKYEKTIPGFLMREYRNMQSRIMGIQKNKAHLYKGKELLTRTAFYEWANGSPEFHSLFNIYEKSGYMMKLCPTVDRIDSSAGYSLENMEWVTHSENSRRGNLSHFGLHQNKLFAV